MDIFSNLWVEKYRPKTIKQIVLPDNIKEKFEEFKTQQTIPHLLFVSPPGQGKTSLAKIIVTDILDCTYLYINASDENGIDTIRTKIMSFATTKSIDGKLKIIILDEADGLSIQAQQALRNCMEEYSSNVRFILTANYRYKIIQAIQSRCQDYDIIPSIEGCIKRVSEILVNEKVSVDNNQKINLITLIRNVYPDIRKIINVVYKSVIDGKLNIQQMNAGLDFAQNVLNKVMAGEDVTSIRRYIIENDTVYNKDYHGLLKDMFNAVDIDINLAQHKDRKRKFMIILAEHMFRHTTVMDPEINCYAAIIALVNTP